MLESFVAGIDRPVTILARSESDILRKPRSASGESARVEVFSEILYGSAAGYLRDFVRLARLARSSDSFAVIGADVMDGDYSDRSSTRRFRVARRLAWLGLDARVLGFSWNDSPASLAKREMRRASRRVLLFARDPISVERLRADGAAQVVSVADLAFLIRPRAAAPAAIADWVRKQRADNRLVAVLNINHGLQRRVDQLAEYRTLLRQRSEQISFLLIPHDSRGEVSDESLLCELAEQAGPSERLLLVDKIVMPDQVVAITALADVTITGRMHLAILSAVAGTPPIALDYQGKVAGLFERLGYQGAVAAQPGLAGEVSLMLDQRLHASAEERADFLQRVEGLVVDASINLRGIATESD